ncbi:hypothetical protein LZ30DRAFT_736183 [Colletotrichum cereale]|nr:hypothetical protein LZ30DRAFT_736183 [Colletotrichum cereale]
MRMREMRCVLLQVMLEQSSYSDNPSHQLNCCSSRCCVELTLTLGIRLRTPIRPYPQEIQTRH